MLSDEELMKLHALAETAAYKAADEYVRKNPDQWYPCGFSWVRIKPARGKLVSFLKRNGFGRTDSYGGGYVIYNPSSHHTQCMEAKRLGSQAYIEIMAKHFPSVKMTVETWID